MEHRYSRDTFAILGPGKASGADITRYWQERAPAARSWVTLPAKPADIGATYPGATASMWDSYVWPVPPELGEIYVEECRRYEGQGVVVNWDGASAQGGHESAYMQSWLARYKRNLAGIGATNDDPNNKGHRFDTYRLAIRAQIAHLLNYAKGSGPWTADDPRASNMPVSWFGSCVTWVHLEQKWAWSPWDQYNATPPENRYGAKLTTHANLMLAQALGIDAPPGGHADPYGEVIRGLVDVRPWLATASGGNRGPTEYSPLSTKRGLVVHFRGVVTPASNPGVIPDVDPNSSTAAWGSFQQDARFHVGKNWCSTGSCLGTGIMYHIGIPGDGRKLLMRELERTLWHCGAWPQNENTLAVQLNLGPGQPPTLAQLRSLLEVAGDWLGYTGAPISELWGHQQLSPTQCPDLLMDRFVRPFRAGELTPPQPPPQPPEELVLRFPDPRIAGEQWPHVYKLGFAGWAAELGLARYPDDLTAAVLSILGLPWEDEWYGTDGHAYQRTERMILHYDPEKGRPFDVTPLPFTYHHLLPPRRTEG